MADEQIPLPWKNLGGGELRWLELNIVRPGEKASDNKVVKEALQFALKRSVNSPDWTQKGYISGLDGYDAWIAALEGLGADVNIRGMAFNAAVWSECRGLASLFLMEAKTRLGGETAPLFDEAAGHYLKVHENLKKLSALYPFFGDPTRTCDPRNKKPALELLTSAKAAEEAGLKVIERIVRAT